MQRYPVWVVKLGGSLESSLPLRELLAQLIVSTAGKAVIVPGGGCFADQVRQAQSKHQFDDSTAHAMAIAAMDQYGLMLCALHPRLRPLLDLHELPGLLQGDQVPVWLPYTHRRRLQGVPATWQASSDSLALWLAGQIADAVLLLLKSTTAPSRSVHELSKSGFLDDHFPRLFARLLRPVVCINANTPPALQAVLEDPTIIHQHCLLDGD